MRTSPADSGYQKEGVTTIQIIARTGSFHDDHGKRASAELYEAASEEEAERFCALWNEAEEDSARVLGGYPGEAHIVPLPAASAATWIREHEEHSG